MPTRLIRLNGTEFHVEVDELDVPIPRPTRSDDLAGRGLTATGVADQVADSGSELQQMLSAVTSSVREALEKSKPAEWTVELFVSFKGGAGVPCLMKGEANASVKLTAKWTTRS